MKNTACGTAALASVTTGARDSAFGHYALHFNTTGSLNTANGVDALRNNTMGSANTASGTYALEFNTTGYENTATGYLGLYRNTTGYENTASGIFALANNTTGFENMASGNGALEFNTTGSDNIGIGFSAGNNIRTGSNNIDISNAGTGILDESNTIRIGTNGTQSATYIAGISATQVTGNVVEVDSNGQLGIAMSSARYKRDIRDMGGASAGLMKLRPVSFRYKNDATKTLQYGLVAEEVARVYPELVTRGPDGKVQSVRYLEITALLLNQLQNQQHEIDALKQQNARINVLSQQLEALEQQARTASSQRMGSLASK